MNNLIYYVYIAKFLDTPYSVAFKFGITETQLRAANPQWKDRIVFSLTPGEEVVLPDWIEKSALFFLYKSELVEKRKPLSKLNGHTAYPADWFPQRPSFGSPSSSITTLLNKLGNPKYTVKNPGQYHSPIVFTDGWDRRNISRVSIPQLNGVPFFSLDNKQKCTGSISFYTKAHSAVQELFKAWESDGLISRILTFEGSFNPRVIGKGKKPSNHSFGTAFDINGPWNGEKKKPAGIGKQGCLLELVPRANELGFYWGGFFDSNIDGMHFEYAKL